MFFINFNGRFQSDSYIEVSSIQTNQIQYMFPHLSTKCINTTESDNVLRLKLINPSHNNVLQLKVSMKWKLVHG